MKWNSLSYLSRRSRHMHMVGLKARQSHLRFRPITSHHKSSPGRSMK